MNSAKTLPSSPPTTTLDYALHYLSLGWSMIPINAKDKKPAILWTAYQNRLPKREEIIKWFGNGNTREYNIGIITGEISGLTVLDVDDLSLIPELKRRGVDTPLGSKTGKGAHLLYSYDKRIRTTTGVLGIKGLDIRNDGGYIVAPPSIHPNGKQYKFYQPDWMNMILSPPPNWLLPPPTIDLSSEFAIQPVTTQPVDLPRLQSALACIPADGYDTWLKVGMCIKQSLGDEGYTLWHDWSASYPAKFDESVCREKWASFDNNTLSPVTIGTIYHLAREGGWSPPQRENFTDKGNGQRLARQYGDFIRFVPEFGKWLIWDGTRWQTDDDTSIMRYAKAVTDQMIREAQSLSDDHRQSLIKYALVTEGRARLESMIELTKSEPDIPLNQCRLDSDPFVFNVANGTINLKSGNLTPFDRLQYITRQSPIEFQPDAHHCTTWLNFLNQIMGGNQGLIRYLQKAFGYSLTGSTQEQCLFFCHGTGANGKSTLLNVLSQLLHDYAMQVDPATLMVKANAGGATPELARLRGARVVITSEVEDGQRLAESTIKQLTGGDAITVRNLYCEPFEYRPTFKIWFTGNHRPIIKGTDHAIWRRIRLLPFTVTIPDEQQDKNLGRRLQHELPGILAWAVEGCRLWQKEGLIPPPEMQSAVQAYREEMDTIGQWLDECCQFAPNVATPARLLYGSYQGWCTSNGCYPLSQKRLGMSLSERGLVSHKIPQVVWKGVALAPYQSQRP